MMGWLRRLPWPWPALLVWALAWGAFVGLQPVLAPVWASVAAGLLALAGSLLAGQTRWRQALMAAGFPASLLLQQGLQGGAALPVWGWLLPLALLLWVYPPGSWRDAPVFPTPPDALDGLPQVLPLPPAATVLDAGCGLGHGLQALHRAYPHATLLGTERSWPLRLWCGWRCPWATVRQGDMWADDWGQCDLVYLFQRPETMPRAMAKAAQQLRPEAWLASLEFADPAWPPTAVWTCPDGRPVWLYQAPLLRP